MSDSICWRIKKATKLGVISETSMQRALKTIKALQNAPQKFNRQSVWSTLSIMCNIDVHVEDGLIVCINANPLYIIQNIIFTAIDEHKRIRADLLCILQSSLYEAEHSNLDINQIKPGTIRMLEKHGIYITRNTITTCTEEQYCKITQYCKNFPIHMRPEFDKECRRIIQPAITPDELKTAALRLLEMSDNDQALFAILPRIALMSVFIGIESVLKDLFDTFT